MKQIVHRSLQIAQSDPKGPVYIVGAREMMEEESEAVAMDIADWPPIAPAPLPDAAVARPHRSDAKGRAAADRHVLSSAAIPPP